MKLITEYTESNLECLVEKNDAGEKQYKIQGYLHKPTRRIEMVEYILKQSWKKQLQNMIKNK